MMDAAPRRHEARRTFLRRIDDELADIEARGLWKPERILSSPQGAQVRVQDGAHERRLVNLCANNYLGLANHPAVVNGARAAAEAWGAGVASVRFICGTTRLHKALEAAVADFLGYEDAVLYAGAFDANGGLFETLLGPEDAVLSDSLNHASIIDGVRLCKARRYRFRNRDYDELEARLREAREGGARTLLIATDGVFSMDGHLADLRILRALADAHGALLMVDDCHATGFIGPGGRGTPQLAGVDVEILTGTFGKALGGAMGGFVAADRRVVALLRQRSRPYLFSNALAPAVCGAAIAALEVVRSPEGERLRSKLHRSAAMLRDGLETLGFELLPGSHPIAPVMLRDARLAQDMGAALLEAGVLATGFSFPVVPQGEARIRTQMSAAHTPADIRVALAAFEAAGRKLGVLP